MDHPQTSFACKGRYQYPIWRNIYKKYANRICDLSFHIHLVILVSEYRHDTYHAFLDPLDHSGNKVHPKRYSRGGGHSRLILNFAALLVDYLPGILLEAFKWTGGSYGAGLRFLFWMDISPVLLFCCPCALVGACLPAGRFRDNPDESCSLKIPASTNKKHVRCWLIVFPNRSDESIT